jgi:hypothetical protein
MKSPFICLLLVGALSFGVFSISGAQTPQHGDKPISGTPPREACRAIETYVALVDAAKSISDPSKRANQYAEAKQGLENVLKRHNQDTLLAMASDYAPYTEQVAITEATNPKLNEYLEKRSKLRETLLEICSGYTMTR